MFSENKNYMKRKLTPLARFILFVIIVGVFTFGILKVNEKMKWFALLGNP
jgi:hypothetical protein